MKEVAEEAKSKSEEAHKNFFNEIRTAVRAQRRVAVRKQQRMEQLRKSKTDIGDE